MGASGQAAEKEDERVRKERERRERIKKKIRLDFLVSQDCAKVGKFVSPEAVAQRLDPGIQLFLEGVEGEG